MVGRTGSVRRKVWGGHRREGREGKRGGVGEDIVEDSVKEDRVRN